MKYSMAPVIMASGLYVLCLDRTNLSLRRIARIGTFGAVLSLPVVSLWWVNHLWGGNKYPLTGGGFSFSLPVFAKNVVPTRSDRQPAGIWFLSS